MKRIIYFFLCIIITICVTGCGNSWSVTPINTENTGSFVSKAQTAEPSDEQPSNEDTKGDLRSETSSSQKSDSASTGSKESDQTNRPQEKSNSSIPATSNTSSSKSNDTIEGDAVPDVPEFADEAALRGWLKNGTTHAKAQAEMLSAIRTQGGYYYRLANSTGTSNWHLQKITLYSDSLHYRYSFDSENGKTDILIFAVLADYNKEFFDYKKQCFQEGKENCYLANINGIEYAYSYHKNADETIIAWEQFGNFHSASLYGHFDEIDQILPLLKLERVSYSTDTVTE